LDLTVESESAPLEVAETHHGGDSCVLWAFFGSRQNPIAVNLLNKMGKEKESMKKGKFEKKEF
jgi:hypothetical protein